MKQILLTQGYSAKVDDEDEEWISAYKWQIKIDNKRLYAANSSPFKCRMHTVIYKRYNLYDPNYQIDHKDNDGLNCQKYNLQLLTNSENTRKCGISSYNTSGFRGVDFNKGKWRARISDNYKQIPLGLYDTAIEAAIAWNRAALVVFGPSAFQNIIPQDAILQSAKTQEHRLHPKNTTGFRGVVYNPNRDEYRVRLMVKGKEIGIGPYKTAMEAAIIWNQLSRAAFGPGAFQNIIPEEEK